MKKNKTDLILRLNYFKEPELQQEMLKLGRLVNAVKGDILIREGQYLDFLPIVIKGSIRVYQQREDREILLYYITPGHTCMMSLSSAYFNQVSAANGMAIEPSEILVFPTYIIDDWQLKFPSWNKFIIQTFRSRYDDLLNSFASVAFDSIQSRVKEYLTRKSQQNGGIKIHVSHQNLANELGTTRVVISRILKQLEREQKVKLFRGYIEVHN